jgi:hypothetical protein
LRQTGINVLSRLVGLLLAVIAVQFVVHGIKAVILEITSGRETGKGRWTASGSPPFFTVGSTSSNSRE